MPTPDPTTFAEAWIAAWNARELEAVLSHYADDVVFTSPTALRFVPDSQGTVRGKPALRRYWAVALDHNPDLRFTLTSVFAGVDTLVLVYRNQAKACIAEVLTFDGGLVVVGHATHLA